MSNNISEVKFQVEMRLGDILISDNVLNYTSENEIRTATINEINGETLDSVMVVSSLDKQSKGGHWED